MGKKNSNDLEAGHGKKPNQKLKPYLVMQYLLKNSDENHAIKTADIVAYLQELNLDAERRSIYRDIEEINKALLIVEDDLTMKEAIEAIKEGGDAYRYIVYDKSKKAFYAKPRRYDFEQIQLVVECIYAAKFLTEDDAEELTDLVCSFVSDYQAEQIRHDVHLTDRIKTNTTNIFINIGYINTAMSRKIEGEKHVPEKISFKYLKSSINDMKQKVERRRGERYSVSPYALLLNDGNYYLLGFDDKAQKILTYRVDRMQGVRLTGEPREGEDEFKKIDLKTYTQRVFSMFGGEKERVTIRFINHLLDAAIDRFGTRGVLYSKVDDNHFSVCAPVEISDQFFGWICGFGKKAKIIDPPRVTDHFVKYIEKIKSNY